MFVVKRKNCILNSFSLVRKHNDSITCAFSVTKEPVSNKPGSLDFIDIRVRTRRGKRKGSRLPRVLWKTLSREAILSIPTSNPDPETPA